MQIETQDTKARGKKLTISTQGKEIARARIYILYNDLHQHPFALLEDVFVQEEFRSRGYGAQMVSAAIEEAKKAGCYKIIGTSRNTRTQVHDFYTKLGFTDYGKEFRMDLE